MKILRILICCMATVVVESVHEHACPGDPAKHRGMSWLTQDEFYRTEEQLKIDEGFDSKIYIDSLGYRTFGIGHLITNSDPENKLPVGTEVSRDRINSAFDDEFDAAASTLKSIYPKCNTWPSEVRDYGQYGIQSWRETSSVQEIGQCVRKE